MERAVIESKRGKNWKEGFCNRTKGCFSHHSTSFIRVINRRRKPTLSVPPVVGLQCDQEAVSPVISSTEGVERSHGLGLHINDPSPHRVIDCKRSVAVCTQHTTACHSTLTTHRGCVNKGYAESLLENSATKKHIQCSFIERELFGFLWFEIILYKQRLIELFGSYVVTIHHRAATMVRSLDPVE
ncbi:hypothetical protein PROFUN_03879 [Planoprotostelium fungivorum]|uniref:Uncharacterized protein n=1 Tax=Planoprotostelium fungivorum TaxID=1890364 RepID=A0A2P6MTL1_9EUKA|nr:hypothetical protein PROFUN_03879 [Planoprotostelium fungivorum]